MAKAAINPPNCVITDPDYLTQCRFALEPSFTGLVRLAEKAGWDRQQVTYSLMMLAAEALQASGKPSGSQPAEG
jgi:hypothetical protein